MADDDPFHDRGRYRSLTPVLLRAAGLVVLVLAVTVVVRGPWAPGSRAEPAPGSPPAEQVLALLEAVEVVDERVRVPGYERSCSGGAACVFGPAWSDHTGAPGGGNGCDTRNDVLATDLADPVVDPDCTVRSGTLADPYTGQTSEFTRSAGAEVHIDHVYALSAAWDMGAHAWPQWRRDRFANDTAFNLLAVGAQVNQDKSDFTPTDWLPEPAAYRCFYIAKYLAVAVRYSLPVTAADHAAMRREADRC